MAAERPDAADLFAEALERAPHERESLLASIADETVRSEVLDLLAAHDRAGRFLDTPALESRTDLPPSSGPPPANEALPGTRIGRWRLERLLGTGGMGEVHLAVRDDDGFVQHGALKLLRPAVANDDLVRRFRAERRALARLEDRGIARLIDGGEATDGRPFLVMEHVEGKPIDAWSDERRLPVDARIALFLPVCDAVSAAHRALVVHRDLKPANILVDEGGAPRLVDFGIAQILDDGMGATAVGAFTPRYASPEQIAGEPVTVATDLYALGVVLQELLSGAHPHDDAASRGATALAHAIAGSEPTRASGAVRDDNHGRTVAVARSTEPAALRRDLRGDIDRILLKALRRDPADRYTSVEAFAEDLRRHLDGRPVLATPPSFRYVLGRFVRRHRASVLFASIAMAALLAGLAASLNALESARRARDDAQRQLATTRAIIDFVTEDVLGGVDPAAAGGADVTMREALEAAALGIGPRLAAMPDAEAPIRSLLGRAFLRLDERTIARSELDRALAIVPVDRRTSDPTALAVRTQLAVLSGAEGQRSAAIDELRRVASDARSALGPAHPIVPEALVAAADLLVEDGRYDEAFQALDEAEADVRIGNGNTELALLPVLGERMRALHFSGKTQAAEALGRELLERNRAVRGDGHLETIAAANNLGLLLAEQDKLDEAKELLNDAYGRTAKILGSEHRGALTIRSNLAIVAFRHDDFAEAERIQVELAEIRARRLGPDHPDTLLSRQAVAMAILNQGRRAEAIPLLEDILARRRAILGDTHPQTLTTGYNLGMALFMDGRSEDSIAKLTEVLAAQDRSLGTDHPSSRLTLANMVEIMLRAGRTDEAVAPAEDLVARTNRACAEDDPQRAMAAAKLERARTAGK